MGEWVWAELKMAFPVGERDFGARAGASGVWQWDFGQPKKAFPVGKWLLEKPEKASGHAGRDFSEPCADDFQSPSVR